MICPRVSEKRRAGETEIVQRGLSLVELLLAMLLMALVSLVLSQAFAVGTDAYSRGKKSVRELGRSRQSTHAFIEAIRSMHPDSSQLDLSQGTLGSTVHLLRRNRAGLEENGFGTVSRGGQPHLEFRRQWPPEGDMSEGGVEIPLMSDVSKMAISYLRSDGRPAGEWSSSKISSTDTPPRYFEWTLRAAGGQVYTSSAYARVDFESLFLPADTSAESDT